MDSHWPSTIVSWPSPELEVSLRPASIRRLVSLGALNMASCGVCQAQKAVRLWSSAKMSPNLTRNLPWHPSDESGHTLRIR